MRDGYVICLEVGREAAEKYPNDIDKAMDFARVKAKRELGIGQEVNPWVTDLVMPTLRHAIHMARANANRQIVREREKLPVVLAASIKSAKPALTTLPAERPKGQRPAIIDPAPATTMQKARQPERRLSAHVAELVGGMAQRIAGKQLGMVCGGELPAIISRGLNTVRGVAVPVYVLQKIHQSGKLAIDQEIRQVFTVAEVDALYAEAESKLPGEVEKLIA